MLTYFYFFARAYVNIMRLFAPLFVYSHVCKNWEGLQTILLQPWCLRYICLRGSWWDGKRTLRMFQERFTNRNHPHHTMFAHLYQRIREDGSLRPQCIGGRPRQTRTPAFEEVLERVGNDPLTSTRAIAHAMGSNQSSMLRFLQEQNLHPYHLQEVQGLEPNDFAPLVRFVSGFCNGASWILPFLNKSCLLMRPASQEMATSTAETATSGTTRIRTHCPSKFTRRDWT